MTPSSIQSLKKAVPGKSKNFRGGLNPFSVFEEGLAVVALENAGMGRNGMGEPDVAADDGAGADGDASQQRSVGIHRYMIFKNNLFSPNCNLTMALLPA